MPAPPAQRPRWPGRLARLLSFRTISGKLIIGLVVLFGLASAAVSLITAQSLSNSLMSSLDGQLRSATTTWSSCVHMVYNNPDSHGQPGADADAASDAGQPDPEDYGACSGQGQAPGTFEAVVSASGAINYKTYVLK
jgi:hypothetical protein